MNWVLCECQVLCQVLSHQETENLHNLQEDSWFTAPDTSPAVSSTAFSPSGSTRFAFLSDAPPLCHPASRKVLLICSQTWFLIFFFTYRFEFEYLDLFCFSFAQLPASVPQHSDQAIGYQGSLVSIMKYKKKKLSPRQSATIQGSFLCS